MVTCKHHADLDETFEKKWNNGGILFSVLAVKNDSNARY